MVVVKSNWLSRGETALEMSWINSKKYQSDVLKHQKTVFPNLMKNCWSFDAVRKSFAGFDLDFA